MAKDIPSSVNVRNDVLILFVYLMQIGLNITNAVRKIMLVLWLSLFFLNNFLRHIFQTARSCMLVIIFQSSTVRSLKSYLSMEIRILASLELRNPAIPNHYLLLLIRYQVLFNLCLLYLPITNDLNTRLHFQLNDRCRLIILVPL